MALRLHLVRHGQTDFSRQNRFCGAINPPLSTVGERMAEALAARWGAHPWTAIYASPLERALQTAAPTAARAGLEVRVEDGLREIAYGEWEGKPEHEVERDDAARFHAWAAHPGWVAPPGGESGAAIAQRALAVVDLVRARHDDGDVLLVSHKATLRVLLCALLGVDLDLFRSRIGQKVCAISVVTWRPSGPLLEVLGDESHLPPELRENGGT